MALFEAVMMVLAGIDEVNCPPMPIVDAVWENPAQRWLIIGEDHGTNEQPEAFLGIVCQASKKRVVTVAVEQAASEQSAIDAFIKSDGSQKSRDTFLSSQIWHGKFQDGRSSQAYFSLFERLRLLYRAGRITSVVAFQPAGASDPQSYEQKMADELVRHSPLQSLTIVLVGGVHAMKTPVSFGGPAYLPMAGHLPASQTMSVVLKGEGGMQWACQSPTDCGSSSIFQDGAKSSDGLTLTPAADAPYSAVFGLGKPTTASPPKIPLTRNDR